MPVWPGNPPLVIEVVRDVAEGAHSTIRRIDMGTHTGTHVDAPSHFIAGDTGLEEMGLAALVGLARVIELDSDPAVTVADLEPYDISEGERVLLKTRNSGLWAKDEFDPSFVYLSTEAAEYLAERRPACVGVDYLSVGGHQVNGTEVHHALLKARALLIEGLDLSAAQPGDYTLVCLPLRIAGAEAAPARAILMR